MWEKTIYLLINHPLSSVININVINDGNWLIMQLIKDKDKKSILQKQKVS